VWNTAFQTIALLRADTHLKALPERGRESLVVPGALAYTCAFRSILSDKPEQPQSCPATQTATMP
jgi:hypothetical protein